MSTDTTINSSIAYDALVQSRERAYSQIEELCWQIDRRADDTDTDNPWTPDSGIFVRGLQAQIAVLHAQIEGIELAIDRDHAEAAKLDAEAHYEQQHENRMLGQIDGY